MPPLTKRRLSAEWEEQDGVLVAWPHEGSDWAATLDLVEPFFIELVREISREEIVVVVAPDRGVVERSLATSGACLSRIRIHELPTNDTWARDFGPLTVHEDDRPLLLDFGFNGWGLKFPANHDNRVTERLHDEGAFGATKMRRVGIILEGGSIDSDGGGTILTTAECLLNPNRNPHLSRPDLEAVLGKELGADRFLWLEHGYLAGDDTDSHLDTLARFCPDDTIIHLACDDPGDEHYPALGAMRRELSAFRTRQGEIGRAHV